MDDIVALAEQYARRAHAGQVDKSGKDYICHPLAVASFVRTPREKCVALLHDTLEDSAVFSEQELRATFGDDIMNSVLVVTHQDGEPYMAYVRRVKHSGDAVAVAVKRADLRHNSDLRRMGRKFLQRGKAWKNVKRYCKYQICRIYLAL